MIRPPALALLLALALDGDCPVDRLHRHGGDPWWSEDLEEDGALDTGTEEECPGLPGR